MTDHRGWNYCPKCKGDLKYGPVTGEEFDRLHCDACGLVLYDNPAPTSCAVVVRDEELMLTRRGIEPHKGDWDLPGGYIEVGEHPEEALVREMREETGLEIEIMDMLGIFLDTYGDGGTDTLNICYIARVTSGEETPASDITEIAWFSPDEVPPNLAFKNTRDALDSWCSRMRA